MITEGALPRARWPARSRGRPTMKALPRWVAALGVGGGLILARAGLGQVAAPQLDDLTRQLYEQVRRLSEDIDLSLGNTPQGPQLLQDTRALAQAIDEFGASLAQRPDPAQLRQAFGGIDGI